jgi:hypothetical protein
MLIEFDNHKEIMNHEWQDCLKIEYNDVNLSFLSEKIGGEDKYVLTNGNIYSIYSILNKLLEEGFFKELKLNILEIAYDDEVYVDFFKLVGYRFSAPGVDKIYVRTSSGFYSLQYISYLQNLYILDYRTNYFVKMPMFDKNVVVEKTIYRMLLDSKFNGNDVEFILELDTTEKVENYYSLNVELKKCSKKDVNMHDELIKQLSYFYYFNIMPWSYDGEFKFLATETFAKEFVNKLHDYNTVKQQTKSAHFRC